MTDCVGFFLLLLQILSTDYEIGHFLRARVVPKAVLYYTGDVIDDDDDEYDEEEEEEEDSEEDDDEEDDEPPPKPSGKHGKHSHGKHSAAGAGGKENPAECKQQ